MNLDLEFSFIFQTIETLGCRTLFGPQVGAGVSLNQGERPGLSTRRVGTGASQTSQSSGAARALQELPYGLESSLLSPLMRNGNQFSRITQPRINLPLV